MNDMHETLHCSPAHGTPGLVLTSHDICAVHAQTHMFTRHDQCFLGIGQADHALLGFLLMPDMSIDLIYLEHESRKGEFLLYEFCLPLSSAESELDIGAFDDTRRVVGAEFDYHGVGLAVSEGEFLQGVLGEVKHDVFAAVLVQACLECLGDRGGVTLCVDEVALSDSGRLQVLRGKEVDRHRAVQQTVELEGKGKGCGGGFC